MPAPGRPNRRPGAFCQKGGGFSPCRAQQPQNVFTIRRPSRAATIPTPRWARCGRRRPRPLRCGRPQRGRSCSRSTAAAPGAKRCARCRWSAASAGCGAPRPRATSTACTTTIPSPTPRASPAVPPTPGPWLAGATARAVWSSTCAAPTPKTGPPTPPLPGGRRISSMKRTSRIFPSTRPAACPPRTAANTKPLRWQIPRCTATACTPPALPTCAAWA